MAVQTQIQVRRGTAATWTSTNPTLAAGELGFETDTGKFKIGTGSSTWTALSYAGGGAQATFTTYQYTATSGQTTFSGVDANGNTLSYTAGSIQVYLNGALLVNSSDYTATNGTSVVLTAGAVTGDSLTVLALGTFTVSTDIPKSTLTAKGSIVTATAGSTPANLSVGADGTVLLADSTQSTGLKWGTAGTTFNIKYTLSTSQNINAIASNGSTIIVAVGTAGVLYSSTDSGTTWASRTSGFGTNAIWHVAFGNGLFVAVGANGTITTSTDGVTWTARTSNVSTNALYCVQYLNSLWVAVGTGANGGTGGITTSSNGTTWTKQTTPTVMGNNLYAVTYGNGYYVAVGTVSTTAGCYSTNGTTWSVLPTSINTALDYIYYNGSVWYGLSSGGAGFVSASNLPTSTWTNITNPPGYSVNPASGLCSIAVYNNFQYLMGPTSARQQIARITTSLVSTIFTSAQPPIFTPYDSQSIPNTIFIDSNGKLWFADSTGRIYLAQL